MARAYELLIGLTEVDSESPFYRHHFPGFDGRRGCEGCATDVKKMRELTHYLGYEPVTLEPLINERATRARVLAMLEAIADPAFGITKDDIFFLYISCHGRSLGDAGGPTSASLFGDSSGMAINMFLLHDRPLFNFELWSPLIRWAKSENTPRVFTVIDSCHAGLGTGLITVFDQLLVEFLTAMVIRLTTSGPPDTRPTLSNSQALIQNLGTGLSKETTNQVAKILEAFRSLYEGIHVVHFGAVRDELTAAGGDVERGSPFTRRFRQLFLNGGDMMGYDDFFTALKDLTPARHTPVKELVPIGDGHLGAEHSMSCQTVFQI